VGFIALWLIEPLWFIAVAFIALWLIEPLWLIAVGFIVVCFIELLWLIAPDALGAGTWAEAAIGAVAIARVSIANVKRFMGSSGESMTMPWWHRHLGK
jgi:hypothetical protein